MTESIILSEYFCYHEGCRDYGKKGLGNIVIKEHCGKDNHAILKCRTCGHCFSETRGTIFFGLRTPVDEVLRTLAMLPEKGSIRAVARATGHDKNTICNWLKKAAEQARRVNEYFIHNLNLKQVQIDEIWSFCKKSKKMCKREILKT
jgi:transposase-like protein